MTIGGEHSDSTIVARRHRTSLTVSAVPKLTLLIHTLDSRLDTGVRKKKKTRKRGREKNRRRLMASILDKLEEVIQAPSAF
jgi:hypothetical protein